MKTAIECIPCFVRQAAEAIEQGNVPAAGREAVMRAILHTLAEAGWDDSPPAIAQNLHRIIRAEMNNPDPYRPLKERMNRLALEALPLCRQLIESADDPLETVVRIVVAGNLLDAGAKLQVRPEDMPALLDSLWQKPLAGDPHALFRAAESADRILYLADNAGEIVLDALLLEKLPAGRVTLAVRGKPVLNDALIEDASLAGIPAHVAVIDNGSDAPGTVLPDVSPEFLDHFRRASLIISKGQGNYETLAEIRAPIVFLFTVKCPLVAARVGEPVGTMVVKANKNVREVQHGGTRRSRDHCGTPDRRNESR
jgi:damage-control phosphatase, subfamily I